MALDKNLFTLNIEQSKIEPNAVDLADPSGIVHYRKRSVPDGTGSYLFSLSDPLSDSLLATAAAPSVTSKEKVIELHNPSATVPLSFKGTLTFKWLFAWEQNTFEWKKEACYMVRKPDPPVIVAVTKEPTGKIKTSSIQILDYNLNRFDIEDRKGLEIVLLMGFLTFIDQAEQLRSKSGESSVPATPSNVSPAGHIAPRPPPKPEGWRDQIAILQAKEQREINEVVVGEAGEVEDYVKHCVSLLKDDTLLFITLRSHTPASVSKVVQVAEAAKRTRYKNGGWDEDLHQYVSTEETRQPGKGKGPPPVINLNDRSASSSQPYKPPASLTIHLSKIAMPELEPKTKKGKQHPDHGAHSLTISELTGQKSGKKPPPTVSKPHPVSPTQKSNAPRARRNSPTSSPSPSTFPPPYISQGPNDFRPFPGPGPAKAPRRGPAHATHPLQHPPSQAQSQTLPSGSFLSKLTKR